MAQLKDPGPAPRKHMPAILRWGVVNPIAWVFDAAKFACTMLIFLAPLAVGITTKLVTEGVLEKFFGVGMGSWLASLAGVSAAALTAGTEIAVAPITTFIEGLAVILAVVVGIIGCLVVTMILALAGRFSFFDHPKLFMLLSTMVVTSMVPFVDAGPTLSIPVWRMTAELVSIDKHKYKAWKKKHDEFAKWQKQQLESKIASAWQVVAEKQSQTSPAIPEALPQSA